VSTPVASIGSPAAEAVTGRLFRALAVLRVIVLLNAVAIAVHRSGSVERPVVAVGCYLVMGAWTAVSIWAYAASHRRTAALLGADLGLAIGLLLATPWVRGADFGSSVPGFWVMGALLAWAICWRTPGGLVAGLVLAGTDLLLRQDIGLSTYGNQFLLVIGGPIVGFMCASLQQMATERDAAERAAAAAEERARLARAVHDGVLQVLALVQRLGGEEAHDVELARLGRAAAEQERQLRTLIRAQDPTATRTSLDLAAALGDLERRHRVTVATPGSPVELPAPTAREIVAAAAACLDNVRTHVGADARAYVLLQAFPDRVEVCVRDDGPGIPPGRIEQAEAEGRLGVSESIQGRIAALGGTAHLATGSFGTEWELVVPREGVRP